MTRETVKLSVLRGNYVVLVDQVVSDHEFRVVSPVGSALPVYCTAHGKALLATMEVQKIRQRLGGPWEPGTARTIASLDALIEQLARWCGHPVCFDEGEHLDGFCRVRPALPTLTSQR